MLIRLGACVWCVLQANGVVILLAQSFAEGMAEGPGRCVTDLCRCFSRTMMCTIPGCAAALGLALVFLVRGPRSDEDDEDDEESAAGEAARV
jgi:hypothetical protein